MACLAVLSVVAAATAHAQTSPTSVQLTWTAPGDDGSVGTASVYDLRFSTSAITASNFATATRFTGTPTPAVAGTSQSVTVTGLQPATTYYFAIKAQDNAGNWSNISNIISKATLAAPDLKAPAAAALNVTVVTDTTATLSWSAVGDDSLTGTATSYDIRYSTSPITTTNWTSANQVTGEPTPASPGTTQTYVVRSLVREGTYYFAMKVSDDAGNVSPLSNVPTATTPDSAPPSAILNLTANLVWLGWHAARVVASRDVAP